MKVPRHGSASASTLGIHFCRATQVSGNFRNHSKRSRSEDKRLRTVIVMPAQKFSAPKKTAPSSLRLMAMTCATKVSRVVNGAKSNSDDSGFTGAAILFNHLNALSSSM